MTFIDTGTARARAESLMTSTCRIFTPGAPVTNSTTGGVTYPEVDPITTPCRVRPAGTQSGDGDSGGAETVVSGYVVSIPFTLVASVLQRVVITDSPDPSLVDLSLEIRQVARGDNITARRLLCEEVA